MTVSNTFPDAMHTARTLRRLFFALFLPLCLLPVARALDPTKATSQYIQDTWSTANGFPGKVVHCIAQTPDGYLWIGAEEGLVRFDGLNFRLITPPPYMAVSFHNLLSLAVSEDGSLWIRLQDSTILRYRDGRFSEIPVHSVRTFGIISVMQPHGKDPPILSTVAGAALRFNGKEFEDIPTDAHESGVIVISLAQTPDGRLWKGKRDSGLSYIENGNLVSVEAGLPDTKVNTMLPVGAHDLWVGTDNGVVRWNGHDLTSSPLPAALAHVQAIAMASDRDQNVWIGTAHGLLRVNSQGVAPLLEHATESTGTITAIFEDREGNLWAGGTRGITRLRDATFSTFSAAEGLPSNTNGAIYPDPSGRIWFAPIEGGLFWISGDAVHKVALDGLDRDIIYSIAGSGNDLWLGRQRGGLTHLHVEGSKLFTHTYTHRDGLAQDSVYTVHRARDGAIWAGTLSAGVSVLHDGKFDTYDVSNGLLSDTVASVAESPDGTVWFGTTSGLTALSSGRWKTYVARDGLPSEEITALCAGLPGALLVGTTRGLALLDSSGVHLAPAAIPSLHDSIFGITSDRAGSIWVTTPTHLLRLDRDKLVHNTLDISGIREFGLADGLLSIEGVRRSRSVATDPQGRVWFSMSRGISVTNPNRNVGSAPALAQIETISADGAPFDPLATPHLPASSQRIAFSFSGVTLSIPERVRFRYRLDGFDHDWSGPVATRDAVYTNLDPGKYTFRVLASSSDGQWSSPEAVTRFIIEPAVWETLWFRLLCIFAAIGIVLIAFRLRMLQMTAQLNLRFEERLAERTRIAQELHDTLLQGCLSASMQLDVAYDLLATDSPSRPLLGRVLQLMHQVVDEGRNALLGLRTHERAPDHLEQSFNRVAQELAIHELVAFSLHVEGHLRRLHPLIRDEVYRIGREALVNAVRHADATTIRLDLVYADHHLFLSIRDNGHGIEEQVLREGREGHWGLSGMRERAHRIGARLRILNHASGGAEVGLIIPGHIAYLTESSGSRAFPLPVVLRRVLQWLSVPSAKEKLRD